MAVSCFCITLAVIAVLLTALLLAGDSKTLEVKGITTSFIICILVLITAYAVYRIIDGRKGKNR